MVKAQPETIAAGQVTAGQMAAGQVAPAGVIRSMTGFAARRGQAPDGTGFSWEMRSVNGRGLDLRFRLPEGLDAVEAGARSQLGAVLARGSVTLSLRLERTTQTAMVRLDEGVMSAMLAAVARIEAAARAQGLDLAPSRAADILTLRGVLETGAAEPADNSPLVAALLADLPALIADFDAMRAQEGAALAALLVARLDRVAELTEAAAAALGPRAARMAETLREALARLTEAAPTADPARLEQELAMLAVKTDVAEELDRLRAHVAAARALLEGGGPVGRKLDFLTQEFNREANTLCSKAQSAELTRIGLDLKAVIDQMREQVQNVE